jgi:hypothetical protein
MSQNVRDPERGSALLLVVIVLAVLLAGAALSVQMQSADTRITGMVRSAHEALYCAEAGLVPARGLIGANFADWPAILDDNPQNDPAWYPIRGDVGDGGDADYEVTVRDNDDEKGDQANDRSVDRDLQIFVVSRCLRNSETPREVTELVSFQGGGNVYRDQAGQGSGNTGNSN